MGSTAWPANLSPALPVLLAGLAQATSSGTLCATISEEVLHWHCQQLAVPGPAFLRSAQLASTGAACISSARLGFLTGFLEAGILPAAVWDILVKCNSCCLDVCGTELGCSACCLLPWLLAVAPFLLPYGILQWACCTVSTVAWHEPTATAA